MSEHYEHRPKQQESEQQFAQRVLERTGVSLEDMQEGTVDDLVGSHIFARREKIWVIATGYPTRVDEETGEEFWEETRCFKKVTF